MANVTINSIDSLNNDVLELKSKVNNSLKSNIDSLNSTLNSVGNYSNNGFSANVGDISKTLKSNFDSILTNMTNATENIFNYASYINEFNVNDYDSNAKAVDLNSKYNKSYLHIEDDDKDSDDSEDKDSSGNSSSSSNSNSSDDSGDSNKDNSDNNNSNNSDNNKKPSGTTTPSGTVTPTGVAIASSVILMEDTEYSNNFEDNTLKIINNVTFDNEGFAKFENRYVVQMNEGLGKVGDLIDITQSDGSTLNCIIGLTQDSTTDNSINFFVNQNTFTKTIEELHPTWLKNITSINNTGNYFNNVK